MRKISEIKESQSCLNKARDNEMLFVLLGRDKAAPFVIRMWVQMRITLGLNLLEDEKIQEALNCADVMERER